MRILAISNLYPNPHEPNRGAFNRHQFAALARRHEVRVVAPVSWTDEAAARLRGRPAFAPGRRATCDGLAVDHPRYYHTPKVLRNWYGHFYRWSIRRRFREVVDAFKPDVVYGTWAYPDGWAAVRLARAAGLPVVLKVHGCDVLCGGRGLQSDPVRMRRTVDALRGADRVVSVSRHLADGVAALGVDPARVRTIYNGVDGALFYPGPARDARGRLGLDPAARLVVFVGRLDPVKGLDVLVDACAKLAARGESFKCHVVGDGPLRSRLTQRVAELGLGDTVLFMGGRPQQQLGDWYRAADVVAAPSFSEGVPGVLMEAAACGTPFVASRVGGIPEIAHFVPSVLVPPGDADALAAGIAARLGASVDPGATRPAGRSMRSHDEGAEELARVFAEVVPRPAGAPDEPPADAAGPRAARPQLAPAGVTEHP